MHFDVSQDCTRLGLRAGAIIFRDLYIGPADDALRADIRQEAEAVRSRWPAPGDLRTIPEVAAFDDILRRVGVNPRRDRPSVARLLELALKRGDLPGVNNLVDAYNLVSLRTLCSLGAHDLDAIRLPVTLRLLDGSEHFTPLGQDQPTRVSAGEFGYVDGHNRLLCRLDVRQAEFSKVREQTRNALLIIEGTARHGTESFSQASSEVVERVVRHCGGTAEVVAWPD
jgi:DNA/RNA-binding domain of Phe-tRNA-synthetase-like protein